jgi:hypothetical protein
LQIETFAGATAPNPMSEHDPTTLEVLTAFVRGVASGVCEKMPTEIVCSVMLANNRILAAAVIENGGKLTISPDSLHEMLTTTSHVVAVASEDGSLAIILASKEEIITNPTVFAL